MGAGYYLYAINPDGSFKWKYDTGGDVKSSPAIGSDGTIYVGSDSDKLYAIHPDGSLKWNYTTEGNVHSSPALGADGTIYVGSKDDHLYAINPDGSLKWKFKGGGEISSSPAIGDDGRIYVGCGDGKLYAIHSDSPGLANSPWPKFHRNNQNTGNVIDFTSVANSESPLNPKNYYLEQNYPNPFNARTTITYRLPERTNVSLKLFDIHGREVLTLVKGRQTRGRHQIRFDSRDLSSGIYFYRLVTERHTECRRMLILK